MRTARKWLLAGAVVSVTGVALGAGSISIPLWHGGSVPAEVGDTVKVSCSNAIAHVSVCKGVQCSERTYPCAPYACAGDGMTCQTECESSAQCAAGATCNPARSECTSYSSVCADPFTRKAPDGNLSSCAPYKCVAGNCQQQCVQSSDCAQGYTCTRGTGGRYYCKGAVK